MPEADKARIGAFMQYANVIYIDGSVEEKTISLRQQARIATPDAIIAATALVYNLTLVTRNEKDWLMFPDG